MDVIIVALAVAATVAVVIWDEILRIVERHLLPWLETNHPDLVPTARDALVILDKVAVGLRVVAERAWRELRRQLISQTLEFVRRKGKWFAVVESFLRIALEDEFALKTVSEEEVAWAELPEEVRENWLRSEEQFKAVDVRKQRDRELQLAE